MMNFFSIKKNIFERFDSIKIKLKELYFKKSLLKQLYLKKKEKEFIIFLLVLIIILIFFKKKKII